MYLVSAIVLGLMGSFHCVGMCGPIAIALPLNSTNWFTRVIGSLLYNLGRAFTYAIMGAVFGVLGEGLQLGGFQRWISVVMGVVMILAVVFPTLFKGSKKLDKYLYGYNVRLKKRFGLLFNKASYSSLLIIGLLNGLLPCGLVYMALAGAIATGGVSSGALFMFVFGLGTLPMLLLLSLIGNVVSGSLKSTINKMIPYVIVIIGTLFILRGMNLGIKYISPPENRLHPNDKPMKMNKKMNKGDAKEMTTLYLYTIHNRG
jgi:sulfite exporter TauE/SafE